jgi:hypothetical protein
MIIRLCYLDIETMNVRALCLAVWHNNAQIELSEQGSRSEDQS